MRKATPPETAKEISCRITRTLLLYVRENNRGDLGGLLDGLALDETYLLDTNNWVSHAFLQILYQRMIQILGDDDAVYHMTLASERFQSLGILDRIVRLLGSPKLIYSQAPKYNKYLKLNGDVHIHEIGPSWVVLEDRYHDGSQKTRFDCDYTRGVLAGIPILFGLPMAEVEEIECQVAPDTYGDRKWPDTPRHGESGCLYRVWWEPKRHLLKRLFTKRHDYSKAIEELQQANQLIQAKYDEVRQLVSDLETVNRELTVSKQELESQRKELAESERLYRLLAENASDIIWVLRLSTLEFEYMSPSVERIRGFPLEEAMTLDLEQTLSPASYQIAMEIMEEELAKEGLEGVDPQRSRRIELEQSLKSGGYAWCELIVSFVRDDQGKPISVMGVTRDISERKQAEAAIAKSEEKYRNLFENGMDLLCVHDMNGTLLETNLPFKKEYGWGTEDLGDLNIRDLISQRYKNLFDEYMERITRDGSAEGLLTGYTKSGRKVVVEYKNRLIRDADGTPVGVQGAARDVTERLKTEKALKVSEEKYREIVQYAPAGIYEFDIETMRFTSVNDVMCEYSGYTEEEFLSMDPYGLLNEEGRKTLDQLVKEVFKGRKELPPVEYQIKGKGGREFWALSNSKFFYEEGVPKRGMSVVHDLTQIRKAEAEKRQLEIKLQNAKKLESLGTLAGGVAHDLNNILGGIVTYPELLLVDLPPDSPLKDPLLTIKKSGEKAAEIVQDLLTLARRGVSKKQVLNLNQIVSEFMTSPEYRKITEAHNNLEVETRITENLLNLLGSEVHIGKSLMNLVSNAVDAMPNSGHITISTRNCYIDKPHQGFEVIPEGEYCALAVADTGIGISENDLQQIFEPFYTRKSMGRSGTGLGMSVVWGTIKDHGGYIDIVTEEGSGTEFVLYFPVSRSEQKKVTPLHIDEYIGKGESILIVDDVPEQRELAERMMARLGYRVDTAASGEEAILLVQQNPYDLVILDMIMPDGMNGLETYREILKIAPDQKAVIASGFSEKKLVSDAENIGVGSYVRKPYTLEKIGLAVRSQLDSG